MALAQTEVTVAEPRGAYALKQVVDETGKPSYCLAEAKFDNGLSLMIALSPDRKINLGLTVPDAGFKAGESWPITLRVDGAETRTAPAEAIADNLLRLPLGQDDAFFKALMRGQILTFAGPMDASAFDLRGTGRALDAIQNCSDVVAGRAPAPAARRDPAAARHSFAAGKGTTQDLPPPLRGVLEAAGFKDLQILSLDAIPPDQRPADFAWQSGAVFGGVRERRVPQEENLVALSGAMNDAFRARCAGEFSLNAGTVRREAGLEVQTTDITCATPERPVSVALFYYLTATRLFTLFMFETPVAAKTEGLAARDAIMRTIIDFAKQESAASKEGTKPARTQ